MKKITPFLWFPDTAKEAVSFYTSIFKNSDIKSISYYTKEIAEAAKRPEGSVMTVEFVLEGQNFIALNGGPNFTFSGGVSFVVNCKDQKEVDYYWEKLSEGGRTEQCGWVIDKYGLPWQVVPEILSKTMKDKNTEKARRAAEAMLKMQKIIISDLKKAIKKEDDIVL